MCVWLKNMHTYLETHTCLHILADAAAVRSYTCPRPLTQEVKVCVWPWTGSVAGEWLHVLHLSDWACLQCISTVAWLYIDSVVITHYFTNHSDFFDFLIFMLPFLTWEIAHFAKALTKVSGLCTSVLNFIWTVQTAEQYRCKNTAAYSSWGLPWGEQALRQPLCFLCWNNEAWLIACKCPDVAVGVVRILIFCRTSGRVNLSAPIIHVWCEEVTRIVCP